VRSRALGIVLLIFWSISILALIFTVALLILHILDTSPLKDLSGFLVDEALGNAVVGTLGLTCIILSIGLLLSWLNDQRWKDLRYKMAFYLYHSRVKKGQMIPLDHLAKVAICSFDEICETLEMMIGRGELKGLVDRDKRLYKHLGLTRRGMKFLMALPPAKLDGLDDVKRMALKGAVWDGSYGNLDLLEGREPESLPIARPEEPVSSVNDKRVCPYCRKATPSHTHFCTYCGEEFDRTDANVDSEYISPEKGPSSEVGPSILS
jgi:hypothetical protein